MKVKKVLVFGTFDKLHPGHLNFLKQAKKLGGFLIVVVARDQTVLRVKGHKPIENEKDRLKNLKNIHLANQVILGHSSDPYQVIKKSKPDVITLGYDQNIFIDGLTCFLTKEKLKTKVVRLKPHRPEIFKSSLRRRKSFQKNGPKKYRILVATHNPGKVREYREFFKSLPVKFVSLSDLKITRECLEDAGSLAGNSLKKAKFYGNLSQEITVADDTGLFVRALKGRPGIRSARYAQTPELRQQKVLQKLGKTPYNGRDAEFRLVTSVYFPKTKKVRSFSGKIKGKILSEKRQIKERGFGYDPIFYVPEKKKTFAEMLRTEKNTISHRGEAFGKLRNFLLS